MLLLRKHDDKPEQLEKSFPSRALIGPSPVCVLGQGWLAPETPVPKDREALNVKGTCPCPDKGDTRFLEIGFLQVDVLCSWIQLL